MGSITSPPSLCFWASGSSSPSASLSMPWPALGWLPPSLRPRSPSISPSCSPGSLSSSPVPSLSTPLTCLSDASSDWFGAEFVESLPCHLFIVSNICSWCTFEHQLTENFAQKVTIGLDYLAVKIGIQVGKIEAVLGFTNV